MSQRIVERLVGRLMTDEELRFEFTRAPEATLRALCEQGWELSHAEFEALIKIAERIDPLPPALQSWKWYPELALAGKGELN